tara:strand:+ start:2414 stop:2647 length:234 start_codon:yes stop_codon:yes gene_type:complete
MNLTSGGPGTVGYGLDVLGASAIYAFIGIVATILLFSKDSLKSKFQLLALPLSILFVGIVIGIAGRLLSASINNVSK